MGKRITKEEVKIRLKECRRELSEYQYNTCMRALGYTYDEKLGKYFLGDNAFLMNLSDDVNEVEDLMEINKDGYPTYMSKAISDFIHIWGADLTILDGAIDEFGRKHKKGLYCINYRELFSDKKKVRSK